MALDPVADRILKRYEALLEDAQVWRTTWQSLADFIMPNRVQVTTVRHPGSKRMDRVFDGTQIRDNNRLASFIASTLTNLAIKFFSLVVEDDALMKSSEVKTWLEDTESRVIKWLQASNFATESQEMYRDLGGMGTGCILFDERKRVNPARFEGFLFRAEPVGSYVIAEDPEGRVDTLYRKITLSPVQQAKRWGVAALSEKVQRKLDTREQDKPLPIIHAIFPREGGKFGFTRTRMPWASVFVDLDARHTIAEGGYHEFPAMVPRWAKCSGEVYGRGPGHDAYPDIRTLNKAMELMFRAWGKVIDPPINVLHDAVIGTTINQFPGGVNVVQDLNAIQPWEHAGRFEINQQMIPDLRRAISDTFYANQFQLPDKTIITATEVERRLELMQQLLGPTVGRLEWEYLAPLIERAVKILHRAGRLAPPPAALVEYAAAQGGEVTLVVKYEGPLARSQRQSEVSAIERFLTLVAPVSQVAPETLDRIDWDAVIEFIAKSIGVPARLLRRLGEVEAIRQQRQQAQATIQQTQLGVAQADIGQKVAKAAAALMERGDKKVPEALTGNPEQPVNPTPGAPPE